MGRKIYFIIFFAIGVCALEVFAEEDFFKVPLEVREKNRPERLIDNADDPDMRALKEIQDKFFNIMGNSSAGKEFKGFKQLLHLVDSNAGIELGRLMFQGVMIAYGKDNSNELLNEFIDDFQYRVSPQLADSLIDYKDFLKTVDLTMIPLTIQTLFRKDGLGNSLAQLPLGQLVDLVQPEASKYGIDIKAVINGILGKGDSTFPDLVKKLLDNFDVSSLIGNLTKPDANGKESEKMKRQTNPALMLIKPYISKLLKENKVDLDPDAVIQVLTPFVAPLIQSFMPSAAGKDGKQQNGFDFSQLLPMLTLLGSQLGESRGKAKKQEKLPEEEIYESNKLEDKIDKKDPAGNALNMLSGLLEMSDNMKKGKIDETETGNKEQELLQIALSLIGNMGGKGKKDDSIGNLMSLAAGALQMTNKNGKKSEDPSANTMELLQLAMSLMGNLGDKKSEDDPMSNLLGLASSFMGNQGGQAGNPMAGLLSLASTFMDNNNKDGRQPDLVQMITGILGGPNGKDIRSMVKMAAALFGTGKNKRRDPANVIDQSPEGRKVRNEERKKRLDDYKDSIKTDPRYLAAKKNVETVLKDLKEIENETVSEDEGLEMQIVNKTDKKRKMAESSSEDEFDRTKSFPYALEEFVAGIQSDESVLSKLKQTFTYLKVFIATKFRTKQDFENYLTTVLLPYDQNLNVHALTAPFFLPDKQFSLFLDQLTKEQFSKNKLVFTATGQVLKKALDEKMTENIAMIFRQQFYTTISNMGIEGVTFDNFPEKLGVYVTVLSKTQDLPDDIDQLLSPLQYSLRAMMNWYTNKIMKHSSLPERELQDLFVESLYSEVVLPLKNLWKIRQTSKSSKSCFAREICEFMNNIEEDHVIETLVSQFGSIIFSGFISEKEANPQLFIDTVRATVYKGKCEKVFPSTCEKKKTKKEDDDFQYEHIEL